MDNTPEPEPTSPPPAFTARRKSASGGTPTPPWLWLLLLCGFGLIFYQFVPNAEISVHYYPWFYEQVQADNIKEILIQPPEIRGELRNAQSYRSARYPQPVTVKRFVTNAPSEASIDGVVRKLIEFNEKKSAEATSSSEAVIIDALPPSSPSGTMWMMMLLPAFIILMFLFFVRRAARVTE
jgi:cell division protease FtsH